MKLGLVIASNDAETVWNAFRFANYAAKNYQDEVRVFLLGKGVEAESLDSEEFKIVEQMEQLASAGGTIRACGTCSRKRGSDGSEVCPISNMADLHTLVAESDKILTF